MSAAEYDPSSESIVYEAARAETATNSDSNGAETPPDLRFLHFNDVYHVESGSAEPVGGIARFQSVINYYRSQRPPVTNAHHGEEASQNQTQRYPEVITLFSGDVFNPCLESSITKGQHMVPVLNGISPAAACVGNHDLDFGIAQFRHLRNQCKFPFLLANVLDPNLGEDEALANCPKTAIIESSNGIKIGLIGLAEREWLDTINSLPPNLIYQSASETAKRLVPDLRAQGAEIIIALTHQREPNDNKLAEKCPEGLVDMVLGGHDHFYGHSLINGTHVLRSGTDFKQLSYIEARRRQPAGKPGWDIRIVRRDITHQLPEDPATVELVNKLTSSLMAKMEKPVGYTAVPIDARFLTVRLRESNAGNFICDLMRHFYSADCAIMAAGTIRGDQIYEPGVVRLKDVLNCFPFEDPVVVLRVTGQAILDALENGVCLYPALEGRFPQVSNIKFAYDPSKPSKSRILWTEINGEPLDLSRKYTLATRGYMSRGKDGYTSLLAESEGGNAEEFVSEENGMLISMIVRQYFSSLKVFGRWARFSPSLHRHWGGVHRKLQADGSIKPARVKTGLKARQTEENPNTGHTKEKTDVDGHTVDSDTDDENEEGTPNSPGMMFGGLNVLSLSQGHHLEGESRRKHLARKYARKWMARVGVDGRRAGEMVEQPSKSEWSVPHWTHGIAPKVEGRIINVLENPESESNGQVK